MSESVSVVLLSQGDELTCGQITDTNSSWLAARLTEMGLTVRRIVTAPDRLDGRSSPLWEGRPFCILGLLPSQEPPCSRRF